MSENNILANLGVNGVTEAAGSSDYEGYLVKLNASGELDPSVIGSILLTPLYATYYIDDVVGDDTNGNGSIGAPYKTIAKAVTVNAAGTPGPMVFVLSPGSYAAPTITNIAQDHIVFIGSDPLLVTLTGNVIYNNGNTGTNWVTLVGLTASVVEDLTTLSTFNVAILARTRVDTVRYVIGAPGVYGSLYQMPGTTLVNTPPTNMALVTASATQQVNETPVGTQDGVNTTFTLPASQTYIPDSIIVYLNGVAYGPTDIQENGPGYTTFDVIGGVLPDAAKNDVFAISYSTYSA